MSYMTVARHRFAIGAISALGFYLGLSPDSSAAQAEPAPVSLASLQSEAEKFHAALVLPVYEETAEAIRSTGDKSIQDAEAALDQLAKQDLKKVTFASSVAALDEIIAKVRNAGDRISLLQEAHPEKAVRDAAAEASVKLSSWSIGLEYRDDIYRAIKAYADTKPKLSGEDKLLFDETLRDYRR